ncbi:MAG: ATP-binding protein [Pirellulaceae bacterium]|nr:ATP-binding protein [Pirellulaceae bacterium]
MDVDIRGRVANVKLSKSRCLLPLFEAIMNSLHAIDEAKVVDGRIEIRIERDKSQKSFVEDDPSIYPISGFAIIDNGIGFTDHHFRSFCKSDTTEKFSHGGKGVGRFLWLKAFKNADVKSVFKHNGLTKQRQFHFALSDTGVWPLNPPAEASDSDVVETQVRLSGFLPDYQKHCPKRSDIIANRIVEHFLELFILRKCPRSMVLVDPLEETRVDLNRRYSQEMKLDSKSQPFQIRGEKFKITHVRLDASHAQSHMLNFCAHGRVVRTEPLSKLLPYLDSSIPDANDGRQFVYSGYVAGNFLDQNVMSERTQFDISEEATELDFPDELSWSELLASSIPKAKSFLAPFAEPLNLAKQERIREYIRSKAPQYRHLLQQCKAAIGELPSNLTDEKLDLELYKIDQRHDSDLRTRYERLLEAGDKATLSHDEQRKKFEQFLQDWNEAGMAKLARHVSHRKATLAFLEQRLGIQDGAKYALEEAIHEVIFPLKASSDDIRSDQMNLWILDEKLAFHFYLASDKRLDQLSEVVNVESGDRPDLAIFGHPFAFADSSPVFGSVVLVEFKRPSRDDYSEKDDKNPIQQVYGYVNQIKAGKAKDRHGRQITIPATTPFYAYIVSDITPTLEQQAVYAQLTKTPDGLGYFGYNTQVGVYVEIISFSKLIGDARKRNTAFFEKLGLGR